MRRLAWWSCPIIIFRWNVTSLRLFHLVLNILYTIQCFYFLVITLAKMHMELLPFNQKDSCKMCIIHLRFHHMILDILFETRHRCMYHIGTMSLPSMNSGFHGKANSAIHNILCFVFKAGTAMRNTIQMIL